MSGDIHHAGPRLPLIGEGDCVVCEQSTDTGIAAHGTGDWPVALLMRVGFSYEEAMIVVAGATGCLTRDSDGTSFATVPKEPVTVMISLCAGCAEKHGNFYIEPIASGRVPLYRQPDPALRRERTATTENDCRGT